MALLDDVVNSSLLQVEDAAANMLAAILCPCKLSKEVVEHPVVDDVEAGLGTCCSISYQLLQSTALGVQLLEVLCTVYKVSCVRQHLWSEVRLVAGVHQAARPAP